MAFTLNEDMTSKKNDYVDLSDLIKTCYQIFCKYFRFFAALGISGSILGFSIAFFHVATFKAESRFIIKEGSGLGLSSTLGSLSNLLGNTTGSSIERTFAVISSEKIVGKILLTRCSINGVDNLVINHYINLNRMLERWRYDTLLSSGVSFNFADTTTSVFNRQKRKAYKVILEDLIGKKGLVSKSLDKKTGIVTLSVTFRDEEFAIRLNEMVYDQLKYFIREQASEVSTVNSIALIKKVDSIQNELSVVRKDLARRTDQSFGLILNEDKVELKSLAVKEQILLAMYAEAQKNLETVLFLGQSASNSANVILIDKPYSPIKPIQRSKFLFTLLGLFITMLLSFSIIFLYRWCQILFICK